MSKVLPVLLITCTIVVAGVLGFATHGFVVKNHDNHDERVHTCPCCGICIFGKFKLVFDCTCDCKHDCKPCCKDNCCKAKCKCDCKCNDKDCNCDCNCNHKHDCKPCCKDNCDHKPCCGGRK